MLPAIVPLPTFQFRALVLEVDDNHLVTNAPNIITVRIGALLSELYAM
jgi:hypothetical protein